MLLGHLFARPEEPVIVKFLSKVGAQLGQHLLDFLPLVLQRMETQERYIVCAACRVSCYVLTVVCVVCRVSCVVCRVSCVVCRVSCVVCRVCRVSCVSCVRVSCGVWSA